MRLRKTYRGVNNLAGHLVNYGKHRTRRSYARIKEVLELPNLIEIQSNSYQWFLEKGLVKCLMTLCQLTILLVTYH